jgi:hypothetical protein
MRRPAGIAIFALCLLATTLLAPVSHAADALSVEIVRPAADETVHSNLGEVAVALTLTGVAGAPRLRILLDGRPFGAIQRTPVFTLQGVERGTHSLRVELVDARNAVVATSGAVTFHMWQASRLFPGRQP